MVAKQAEKVFGLQPSCSVLTVLSVNARSLFGFHSVSGCSLRSLTPCVFLGVQ